jgi:Phage integrase family
VTFAAPGDDGLVFTSSEGKPLRRSTFCRRVWHPALRAAGLPAIHFHDLRHTGNQFAADEGANLRELMDRMGHSTTRAAMGYLHGSDERQQVIADALSSRAAAEMGRSETRPSGTQRARRRGKASWALPVSSAMYTLSCGFVVARPAGFEPATRCLEAIPARAP